MIPKCSKLKTFFPFTLILLANLTFFIWRSSMDTLVAYQHLMLNIIGLSFIIVIIYIVKIRKPVGHWTYNITDIWIILFTLLVLGNIKENYSSIVDDKNLLTYFSGVGLYSVIRLYSKSFTSERVLQFVLLTLLLVEIGFLLIEGIQQFSAEYPLQAFKGSFDNSGKLGIYLAMLYPCSLYMLLQSSKKPLSLKIGFLVMFFLLILFLILSLSRIAWVSAFMVSFIMILWHLQSNKKKCLFFLITGIVAIGLVLVMFLIKQDSASGRVLIWKITIKHLDDYWFTGAGYGKFSSLYNLWQADYFSTRGTIDRYFYIADNTFFTFNELLQTAIELGWVGALLWLFLLMYILVNSLGKNLWAVSILAFLTACIASYPFREMQHQVLFFTLLALFANDGHREKTTYTLKIKNRFPVNPLQLFYLFPIFFFGAVTIFCFYQYKSTLTWGEARSEFSFNEKKGISLYNDANIRLQHNAEFLLEYGVRLADLDSIHSGLEALETSKKSFVSQIHLVELGYCYEQLLNYPLAEKHYLQAINVSPSKFAPRYQLLMFYDKTGRVDKAIKVATTIQSIVPKVPSDERAKMIKELAKKYLEKFGDIHN